MRFFPVQPLAAIASWLLLGSLIVNGFSRRILSSGVNRRATPEMTVSAAQSQILLVYVES